MQWGVSEWVRTNSDKREVKANLLLKKADNDFKQYKVLVSHSSCGCFWKPFIEQFEQWNAMVGFSIYTCVLTSSLNRLHSYQFNLLNICFFNFHQFGYNFLIYSVVVEQLFHKLLDQFSDFIRILRRNLKSTFSIELFLAQLNLVEILIA